MGLSIGSTGVDQRSGKLKEGIVKDVLTISPPPHVIKVRLEGGEIGRVKKIKEANLAP